MRVLIGTGGTGGHINPALAIAKHIMTRCPGSEVVFCGAKGGLEEKLVTREGFRLETFDIRGFRRSLNLKGISYNLKILRKAGRALSQAKRLVEEFRPDVAIGCGGYASFPIVYAAQTKKIPTAILEVNALPGLTTKVLSHKADAVMISFEETRKLIKSDKIILTGSPVREDILFAKRDEARRALGIDSRPLIVSVWGSLGAERMNHVMTEFIAMEAKEDRHNLIHAIGSYGYKWVPEEIAAHGVDLSKHPNIEVRDYIYNAAEVYAAADLILCRAGAATLGEMAMMGKPIIIVPSPNVAENHQEKNARAIEKEGGAVVIVERDCTAEKLFSTACELLEDPARLSEMSRNIARFAVPDAMDQIYAAISGVVRN
ncbi:MAG: undecaprenyldiphospho-muramoylpentapeptide beta-N-acetylglucosaminyltransferase [Ruminococcaceae bacterium]|nr:undecaprenyldiphospho-muramoylpentapeptide beta-N-acetylglucosaminyltransferase [Oscillospiraceae bacterium]